MTSAYPAQWLDVRPGGEDVGAYTSESGQRGLKLVVQAQPSLFLETLAGALTATGHLVRGATTEAGTVPELVCVAAPDLCILHDAEPASLPCRGPRRARAGSCRQSCW